MKQSLLVLSSLGLLGWVVEAALQFVPAHWLPNPPSSVIGTVLLLALPVLAGAVGIVGALYAQRGPHAPAWTAIFATLGTLGFLVPLFGCGLVFLSLFSEGGSTSSVLSVASGLVLFPILVFLPALIYVLRQRAHPAEQRKQE